MPEKHAPKNINLEILRGFAALVVVVHHLFCWHVFFDKSFFPNALGAFVAPGHFAVILFFILSGYVIGLNHVERLEGHGILIYLKKRLVRLYPIYFVAMLLTVLVAPHLYDLPTLIANFTFTQNIWRPVFWENNPAWSVNFEVLFYLLFIIVSFWRVKTSVAMLISLLFGILNAYLAFNPLISAYCFGYCFWLAGLYMARNLQPAAYEIKLLPLMFYILAIGCIMCESRVPLDATWYLHFPNYLGPLHWSQFIIRAHDMFLLPFAFLIVMFFTGKTFKYAKLVFLGINIVPLFLILLSTRPGHTENPIFYTGIWYFALAVVTYFIPLGQKYLLNWGVKLGGISYGLYIIHFPVLCLFGRISWFADNLFFYIARCVLFIVLTIALAWLLEKKLQPSVKKWLH